MLAACASGCGPLIYAANITPASRAVERARQADAATYAPYEFYFAEAHLHKAREEAGEAAYQDAIDYARIAEASAEEALEIARRRPTESTR
jgi:hypothetical protein